VFLVFLIPLDIFVCLVLTCLHAGAIVDTNFDVHDDRIDDRIKGRGGGHITSNIVRFLLRGCCLSKLHHPLFEFPRLQIR
jgi:hypothetical protein